ncbi:YybS family protein [Neobacillus rhizosphaerae]|uniref:YybS family protein n=1 Tax=Neobacillus rhizosphaerae TaxID=2880965 RepID=UPI003D2DE4D0
MKNVHKLTEGAILLALMAALILISIYVPILGPIVNIAIPLPFILFSVKNNVKMITAFFVAAIFISFMVTSLRGLAVMLIYGAAGVVIGYMIQKKKSRNVILIASSLTFLVGIIIFYIASDAFFQLNIIHELQTSINESVKHSEELLKAQGQEDQIKLIKEQGALMFKQITVIAPTALVFAAVFSSFVTQWISFPILKRFGIEVQPWGSFRNLSLPKSILWYYLIALGVMLLFHPHEGTYLYTVLINVRAILESLIILQGLAFLFYIFHQRSVAKGLGVLVVILTFMIPIVRYIIMILGITDLGFDFRKQFEKKE